MRFIGSSDLAKAFQDKRHKLLTAKEQCGMKISYLQKVNRACLYSYPERFKTRAAHFSIQRDGRTGMQRATLGKSGSEAASQLQGRTARAFSSKQFGEYHGYDGCYSIYFDSSIIVGLSGLL